MNLSDSALLLLLRPRVVHRLPGRLRVYLPILKHLPEGESAAAQIVRRVLETPEGVASASVSVHTGNVLITYDVHKVTESELVAFVHSVTRVAMANRERLLRVRPQDAPHVEEKVLDWLRGRLKYRLALEDTHEIPDDVLE